jgi:hypothetical protein
MVQVAKWLLPELGRRIVGWRDEGQGMTEYVFVLAILVLAIGAVSLTALGTTLGTSLGDAITRVSEALDVSS